MECYNCRAELTREAYCQKCGADVRIYKQILMASNAFYNDALEKAGVRDLTGAIESLKKSLQLNKTNTEARNLLGLIYYEMGEMVTALSEWVISKNYQSEENRADYYINEIQSNPDKLDTINQTIKKYNQALLYCRQDSRDLAIIQLKKVLSMNPNMVKGHQLLGLLYMQERRYDQAKKSLRNAEKIDENNTITLRYMKEVERILKEENPSKKKKKDDLISYQSGNETIIMPAHFKDTTAVTTIVNIVIGVALGALITWFLLVPNIKQQAKSNANEALIQANDTISTKEQTISTLQKKADNLQEKLDDLEKDSKEQETKASSYDKLLSAYAAFVANDIEGAGTQLTGIKEEDLSESAKAVYEDINTKVNEKYFATLYSEAYRAYQRGDYKTAITNFTKIVETDDAYENGNALYYLAQAYRRNNDMTGAVPYYTKVLENYPGTERANAAKRYLSDFGVDTTKIGSSADTQNGGSSSTQGNSTTRNTGNTAAGGQNDAGGEGTQGQEDGGEASPEGGEETQ